LKLHHYNEMMAYLTRPKFQNGGSVAPPKKPYTDTQFKKRVDILIQGIYGTMPETRDLLISEIQKELDKAEQEGVLSRQEGLSFLQERKKYYDDYLMEQSKTTDGPIGLPSVEERPELQFGGGADAQRMGTEASRVFFKERKVDKPTPTFEGPAGSAKVTDAKFKNPTQEKEYIKILEDRFKFPKGSKEARNVASNADIAKKFGITPNNVERVNRALINKLNLTYPAQTYEGREKIQRERDKVRKENIKKTSSGGVESKIKRDIKKVDPTALAKDVDVAHRASLKANANLGANYLTTSLGIDAKVVNQSIIKPIEQKLGTLYKMQKKLIKDLEPGNVPKDVQKKLEKINIKISELADRTNGVLQGVLVDEKTLKPQIYGVDYSKVLGFGLVDKPVSELTQADRDLIKLNIGEQIKAAKQPNIKSKILTETIPGITTADKIERPEKAKLADAFKKFGKYAKQISKPVVRAVAPFVPILGPVGVGMGVADVAEAAKRDLTNEELGIAYLAGPDVAQKYSEFKESVRGEADETEELVP
jgi:hypothetical protein